MSTTLRRGLTVEPSTLKSIQAFCAASVTELVRPTSVCDRRASMPTRQLSVALAGSRFAPSVTYVKTPFGSGPVTVPEAPLPTAVGVSTGPGLSASAKSGTVLPLIAKPTLLKPERSVITVPLPLVSLKVTVTAPPGAPATDSSSAFNPGSCADRSGTVWAPGMLMSNSGPLGVWQRRQLVSGKPSPETWFVPGGPAGVVTVPGLTLSWHEVHTAAAGEVL